MATDYCTEANIEGWFPGVDFTASTKITAVKVGEFITQYSAYIDSRLHAKYTTPITGTNALLIVKQICEFFVIADVENILQSGLGDRGEEQYPIDYKAKAEKMLDQLESGEAFLSDAASKGSADFYNYNESNDIDPVIDKEGTQW